MKRTFNRRKFIKLSGFATLSAGSGFTVGKLLGRYNKSHFSIYGFLPSDDKPISQIINAFYKTISCNSEPIIIADDYYNGFVRDIADRYHRDFFEKQGTVTFSIKKLIKDVKSDIIVSDNHNSIYSINTDMEFEIRNIRSELKEMRADVFFSAVYNQTNIFSSFIKSTGKEIIINAENGVYDRIPVQSSYKNIEVKGPQGKTIIEVANGLVRIIKSTCKHKLCEKVGYAANVDDIIACAPNKILIKIEDV